MHVFLFHPLSLIIKLYRLNLRLSIGSWDKVVDIFRIDHIIVVIIKDFKFQNEIIRDMEDIYGVYSNFDKWIEIPLRK